ncbi:hypothetical protein KC357_g128 [Hortaea werneckii]|nr:hypothetical protein KC357_g128 [Hortaea werneckii]
MRLSLFFVLIFINDPSSLCSCLWRVVVIFAFSISIVVSSRLRSVSLWRALPSRLLNNSIIGVVIVCYLFLLIRTRKEIILFIIEFLLCLGLRGVVPALRGRPPPNSSSSSMLALSPPPPERPELLTSSLCFTLRPAVILFVTRSIGGFDSRSPGIVPSPGLPPLPPDDVVETGVGLIGLRCGGARGLPSISYCTVACWSGGLS